MNTELTKQDEDAITGTILFIHNNHEEYRKVLLQFSKAGMALTKLFDKVENGPQMVMGNMFLQVNDELKTTFNKLRKPFELFNKHVEEQEKETTSLH